MVGRTASPGSLVTVGLCALLAIGGCKEDPDAPEGSAEWQAATWPEPTEDGLVLLFEVDSAHVVERPAVDASRSLDYLARISDRHEIHIRLDPAPKDLERVRDMLRQGGCCALTSAQGSEEAATESATLRVRLPDVSCDVTLPLHEWDDLPGPSSCEAHVRSLHGRPRFRN